MAGGVSRFTQVASMLQRSISRHSRSQQTHLLIRQFAHCLALTGMLKVACLNYLVWRALREPALMGITWVSGVLLYYPNMLHAHAQLIDMALHDLSSSHLPVTTESASSPPSTATRAEAAASPASRTEPTTSPAAPLHALLCGLANLEQWQGCLQL